MFAFIVAIPSKATATCAGNDTINTMVTRRSTHAHHAKPSGSTKRSAQRRATKSNNLGSSPLRGNHKPSYRASSNKSNGVRIPTPSGGEALLTRRHFLYGALGVGAAAAAIGGASFVIKKQEEANSTVTTLEVPESAVTSSETSLAIEDASSRMDVVGRFELPYGTLVWANGDDVAACLLPTDEAKPLAQVGLLALGSGTLSTVLERAVGQDAGFEIYDVRASSQGIIWTEADILDGIWRIYTASSDGLSIGEPHLVDEGLDTTEDGQAGWETPTIAAAGGYAFWQVLPKLDGPHSTEGSLIKRAAMGSGNAEVVYTSHGRPSSPPYALANSLVITPRAETAGTYYQLTHLDAASGDILDTMVLPSRMRPLEAGYGEHGFVFSFDAIYNYGGGIANMGTYTPAASVTDGNYSNSPWYCFNRTPTAPPAWCGKYFMVKSTLSVCGVDTTTNEYFALSAENGADTYGEYLASTGSNNTVVTFANIDDKPISGDAKKYCLVRVWAPTA